MHTNKTPHYELPQFIGSDIPNPLTDWNDSMQDIDAAMYEIKTQADEIGSDIVEDESDISNLQSQANLTDDNITLLNQQTTAARAAATDAQDAANRNASNITTLQQSVANNRTSITQYNNRFNQNVPFAFGIEEVEDPENPGSMIEAYGYYTQDDPSDFIQFGQSSGRYSDIFVGSGAATNPINIAAMTDILSGDDSIADRVDNTYTLKKRGVIHYQLIGGAATGSDYSNLSILKNGSVVATSTYPNSMITTGDINVDINDVITFTVSRTGEGVKSACSVAYVLSFTP